MNNIYSKLHLLLCLTLLVLLAGSCSFFEHDPLKMAMERYNQKMIKTPYVSPAGYAEMAKCENKYCMYTEAYGYLFSAGYDVPVTVDNLFIFPENMKKSDRSDPWLKYLDNTYKSGEKSFQSDYPPGFLSALNAFRWFEERGLFKRLEGFKTVLTDTIQGEGGPVYVYQFGNHKNYQYSGNFRVEDNNFISKIEFDSLHFYSEPLRDWRQAKGFITFLSDENGDRLGSVNINLETEHFEHTINLKAGREIIHHEKLDDSQIFRLMEHKRRPMVYYDEDWDSPFNFEKLKTEQLSSDLGGMDVLNDQFERNAGTPFIKEEKDVEGNLLVISRSGETYSFVEQKIEEFSIIFN